MPCRKVKDLIFPAAGMGTGMDILDHLKQGDNNNYTSYLQPQKSKGKCFGSRRRTG